MSYLEKYLKYKNKYLRYKNQLKGGGGKSVLFIIIEDDGIGDLIYGLKFYEYMKDELNIDNIIIYFMSEYPDSRNMSDKLAEKYKIIWQKYEDKITILSSENIRTNYYPLILSNDDIKNIYFTPLLHNWMNNTGNYNINLNFFLKQKNKKYYYISDPSPSPIPKNISKLIVDNKYYATIPQLGLFIDDKPIINHNKIIKQYKEHSDIHIFNGFCYSHSFYLRNNSFGNYPNNGYIGMFYLFCMIKYALEIKSDDKQFIINIISPINLYINDEEKKKIKEYIHDLKIKEYYNRDNWDDPEPEPTLEESSTYIDTINRDNLKLYSLSIERVLYNCIIDTKIDDFTVNIFNSNKTEDVLSTKKFTINIYDPFPISDIVFDEYISDTNVPFIGTAGINSLIDCIFKFVKIPICELYFHHEFFVDTFDNGKYENTLDIKSWLLSIYKLCSKYTPIIDKKSPHYLKGDQNLCDCTSYLDQYNKLKEIFNFENLNNNMQQLKNYYYEHHNLKKNLLLYLKSDTL